MRVRFVQHDCFSPAEGFNHSVEMEVYHYFLCLSKESNKEKTPRKPTGNENEPDDSNLLAHFQKPVRTFRGRPPHETITVLKYSQC